MIPEKGCTCWAKKKQRSTEMGDWNRKLEGSTLSYWKQAISSSFSSRYEGSRKLSSCVAISWPGKSWGPVVSLSYNNRWRAKPLWSLLLSSNDASPTLSVIEKNMHYSTKAKFAGIIVEYLHMCVEKPDSQNPPNTMQHYKWRKHLLGTQRFTTPDWMKMQGIGYYY